MLSGLSIRNVVLIESLNLEFQSGMTALTGETGAGKSIILDALSMATGARSDRGLVREGCEKAQCSASFELGAVHPVWKVLDEAEFEPDPTEALVLRRVIRANGRSKAFINDIAISVRLLGEVGKCLMEVHGQHDGRGLLDAAQHILMLDNFGGYTKQLVDTRLAYARMIESKKSYEDLKAAAEKAANDRDFLSYAVEELDRLDVSEGEEEALTARRRFLQGSEGAVTELTAAETALGNGDYESRLSAALSGIERVRDKIGEGDDTALKALTSAAQSLERALIETQEARQAVTEAAGAFDIEPGELDGTEKRLFAIKAAARKYGVEAAALSSKRREFAESLELIEKMDSEIAKAQSAAAKSAKAYDDAAGVLTAARIKAGKKLETSVLAELPALKMERAQFHVHIEESANGPLGKDSVRFNAATNPGSAMGAMDKVASGGELARFALAIKVALAGTQHKVMVFDEVDQGVGGAVASAVGRRLTALSQAGQVFVVTHSPQVAACADQQYRIDKASSAKTTITSVTHVASADREEEIARMLAGETITDEARAAARQLMKAS